MDQEYLLDSDGKNLKFKRETLLNYGMNRWGLNKSQSVGPASELIRACAPATFEEWEEFYFKMAKEKKRNGLPIIKEHIKEFGLILYTKLSEVVQNELKSISEQECVEYAYNLVINRTYEGYRTEIDTIYGQLEVILQYKIEPAPDQWDRTYGVDFYIKVNESYIGLQIKPVSGKSINDYQWIEMHRIKHEKFKAKFGGSVFFVYSIKGTDGKKQIYNHAVIDEINREIQSHLF